MKKIGIMGGSFNPIHLGHMILAEHAYEQVGLDNVLFMPLKNPPHKNKAELVTDKHRENMVRLAIEDNHAFVYSDIELAREGTTYTADTLTILRRDNPDTDYYFIVGSDSFLSMHNWMRPETIFELSTILVAGRDLIPQERLEDQLSLLKEQYEARVIFLSMPYIGIASKDIRQRMMYNQSIKYLVSDKVLDYITKNNLYTNI